MNLESEPHQVDGLLKKILKYTISDFYKKEAQRGRYLYNVCKMLPNFAKFYTCYLGLQIPRAVFFLS